MHLINVCAYKLVFESLHAIDTCTKRKSVNKQCDKACKQDINRILLDSDSLGFESFRFSILNCPSLVHIPQNLLRHLLNERLQGVAVSSVIFLVFSMLGNEPF